MVLSNYFTKFPDFSIIIQVFSNSMIFPCMELFLVIFQVFHNFQSLWEPCHMFGLRNSFQNYLLLSGGIFLLKAYQTVQPQIGLFQRGSVYLFVLMFYLPVNNFSVVSGCFPVFLGCKQYWAENTQHSVSGASQTSSLATLQFQVKLSNN